MCEGSIHVANRRATETEDLVIRSIPNHGIMGYYPADSSAKDQRLVCVINMPAVISEVVVSPAIKQYLAQSRYKQHAMYAKLAEIEGRKNLKVQLRHINYTDVVIVDDMQIPLNHFAEGTRFRSPPTQVGVDAVNAALAEHDKTRTSSPVASRAQPRDEASNTTIVRRVLSMTPEAIRSRARRAAAAMQRRPMATGRVGGND